MNTKSEFVRMMASQTEIALATSVNDECSVRIVNFVYDETSQTLFFASFGDNEKVKDFEENNKVAFTTIPHGGNEHVKAKARVKESELSIFDIKDSFIAKIPDYEETINEVGQFLILFEVSFTSAIVTLDFDNIATLSLV